VLDEKELINVLVLNLFLCTLLVSFSWRLLLLLILLVNNEPHTKTVMSTNEEYFLKILENKYPLVKLSLLSQHILNV